MVETTRVLPPSRNSQLHPRRCISLRGAAGAEPPVRHGGRTRQSLFDRNTGVVLTRAHAAAGTYARDLDAGGSAVRTRRQAAIQVISCWACPVWGATSPFPWSGLGRQLPNASPRSRLSAYMISGCRSGASVALVITPRSLIWTSSPCSMISCFHRAARANPPRKARKSSPSRNWPTIRSSFRPPHSIRMSVENALAEVDRKIRVATNQCIPAVIDLVRQGTARCCR